MTRLRMVTAMTAAGVAGMLALSGCGAPAATADLADETYALTAVGLGEATPSASASAAPESKAPKEKGHRKAGRAYLRQNTLHGEIAVQGKDGTRTIVVQRGTVTASDDKTISVKSSDGFALTWSRGEKLTVRGELKNGAEVGVAGGKDGDKAVARLVVVKKK
ncbi:hypothetical protein AB0J83_20225 [Actinoplanes sp. NPDC049596]|uniref:hypothetical protein n=1 Tax=unclassified Actinoplanes TaxID=2626549 RepID=UPI003437A4F1